MRTMLRLMRCCGVLALLAGCAPARPAAPPPKPGKPPIEFSFRKSQVPTKGMVAGIRNSSDSEELSELVVQVHGPNEKGQRSHRVDSIVRPQDSITVGWVELDGWKLKAGDSLTVRCRQYTGEASDVVPE